MVRTKRQRYRSTYGSLVERKAIAGWRVDRYSGAGDLLDITGHGHHARFGSTSGADTNDPLFLPYTGEKYLRLPGIAGNYASTPDSAAVSVTGDIDLRVKVALDDWTPAADQSLVVKGLSFRFTVQTTGVLRFTKPGAYDAESTVATGLANAARKWVRATASATTVRFYLSDDGEAWAQLGADVAIASAGFSDNVTELTLGCRNDGTVPLAGRIYRAQVYSGIDGTLVADFDPSRSVEPHTSFVASTGETWTINRTASGRKAALVDRPLFLFGTDDYLEVPDHADLDFGAADDFTVVVALRHHNTAGSGVLLAKRPAYSSVGWNLYLSAATAGFVFSDGTNTSDAQAAGVSAGRSHVTVGRRNVSADQLRTFVNGAGGAALTDSTTGTLTNADVVRIGRYSGVGSSYADMEFIGAAIFREALSDAEVALLTQEFAS